MKARTGLLLLSGSMAACFGSLMSGCAMPGAGPAASATPSATVAYYPQVADLVSKNCQGCHTAGGIASTLAFDSYAQAAPYAAMMASYTSQRIMPPWAPDDSGTCHTWVGARWLAQGDIDTIGAWAASGATEGDPSPLPPTPTPLPSLSPVSATVAMTQAYTPASNVSDDFRCFVLDPGQSASQYLTGFQVRPGDGLEVHHVILAALTTTSADNQALALDAQDPLPGYSCFGGLGLTAGVTMVGGWAPGEGPVSYPASTGIPVPGGHKMIMQVHYNTRNGVAPDTTAIDLQFTPTVTLPAVVTLAIKTSGFTIPGNTSDYPVTETFTMPRAGRLWEVFPHAHLFADGMPIQVQFTHAGQTSCLMDIPRWDFHWQGFYQYADGPVQLSAGDSVSITCHYSTIGYSGSVSGGEGTGNEMCGAGLYFTQ